MKTLSFCGKLWTLRSSTQILTEFLVYIEVVWLECGQCLLLHHRGVHRGFEHCCESRSPAGERQYRQYPNHHKSISIEDWIWHVRQIHSTDSTIILQHLTRMLRSWMSLSASISSQHLVSSHSPQFLWIPVPPLIHRESFPAAAPIAASRVAQWDQGPAHQPAARRSQRIGYTNGCSMPIIRSAKEIHDICIKRRESNAVWRRSDEEGWIFIPILRILREKHRHQWFHFNQKTARKHGEMKSSYPNLSDSDLQDKILAWGWFAFTMRAFSTFCWRIRALDRKMKASSMHGFGFTFRKQDFSGFHFFSMLDTSIQFFIS